MEKALSIILDIVSVLFGVVFITLAIVASNNSYFDQNMIREYKENWQMGPIIDIIKTSDKCPQDYDVMITNLFPGNKPGCDCSDATDNYAGNVFEEICDSHLIIRGCKMVLGKRDLSITKWRGANLCVKRLNTIFWNLNSVTEKEECPKGQKKCGQVDAFNNQLCLPIKGECPVNDIAIVPSRANDNFTYWKKITLNDNFDLYFTNTEVTKPIIIEIEARDQEVCVHPFEGYLGQNENVLNNLKGSASCKTSLAGRLIDDRFDVIDAYNENEFLQENGADKIINNIPNYPKPSEKADITLYKINYFGWNKSCALNPEYSPMTLVSPTEEVDNAANKAFVLAVVSVIYFVYITLAVLIFKLIVLGMKVTSRYTSISDLINTIFLIVLISLSCVAFSKFHTLLAPHYSFVEHKCGDEITNSVIEFAFRGIGSLNTSFIAIIFIASIEISFIIFYNIWIWIDNRNKIQYPGFIY